MRRFTIPGPRIEIDGAEVSIKKSVKVNILLIPPPNPSSTETVQRENVPSEPVLKTIVLGPTTAELKPEVHGQPYAIDPLESELKTYVGLLVGDPTGVTSLITATAWTADIGLNIPTNATINMDAILFL